MGVIRSYLATIERFNFLANITSQPSLTEHKKVDYLTKSLDHEIPSLGGLMPTVPFPVAVKIGDDTYHISQLDLDDARFRALLERTVLVIEDTHDNRNRLWVLMMAAHRRSRSVGG